MGTIANNQEKALLEAIKSGTGIAGWHGGLGILSGIIPNTSSWLGVNGSLIRGVIDYRVNVVDHKIRSLKDSMILICIPNNTMCMLIPT